MLDKIIVTGFGIFMLLGGFFGWKAGSKVSLIAGLTSGALVLLTYYSQLAEKNKFLVLAILGALLTVSFLMRFLKTQKVMPSGMLLAVSLAFAVFCVFRYLKV